MLRASWAIVAPSITNLFILSPLLNHSIGCTQRNCRVLLKSSRMYLPKAPWFFHQLCELMEKMPQLSHKTIKACSNTSLQFKTIDWAKGWERPVFFHLLVWSRWKVLILPFKFNRAGLYINEGKARRVYTRLKPLENSDMGSAKIECKSLQGRHLWHFLFAKPCRYSSMTGSLSCAVFLSCIHSSLHFLFVKIAQIQH